MKRTTPACVKPLNKKYAKSWSQTCELAMVIELGGLNGAKSQTIVSHRHNISAVPPPSFLNLAAQLTSLFLLYLSSTFLFSSIRKDLQQP